MTLNPGMPTINFQQLKDKPEVVAQLIAMFTAQQNQSNEGADGAACKSTYICELSRHEGSCVSKTRIWKVKSNMKLQTENCVFFGRLDGICMHMS